MITFGCCLTTYFSTAIRGQVKLPKHKLQQKDFLHPYVLPLAQPTTNQIKSIQKRVIRIIFGFACDMPYNSTLFVAGNLDLAKRWDSLSRDFLKSVLQPSSCLYNLLPPPRDTELISRLRAPSKFPRIPTQTKKYQSFMTFAIAHYQQFAFNLGSASPSSQIP